MCYVSVIFTKLRLVAQCPCIGGRPIHPLLLLAIVAGIWLLVSWIKRVVKKRGDTFMNKIGKIAIVVVLIGAVAAVIAVKHNKSRQETGAAVDVPSARQEVATQNQPAQLVGKGLPALIDIGAGTCIPCKLMAPILEELKKELEGKVIVQFIDLNKYPGAAKEYRINVRPTQIFYDASGKELFRHEGFYSRQDILAKWKELGVDLTGPSLQSPTFEHLSPVKPDGDPEEDSTTVAQPQTELVSGLRGLSPSPKSQAVNDMYPGLTIGAFTYAVASELPEGVVLKAGNLIINENELIEEINEADEQMRPQLKKNAFFVLEQTATLKLILAEAKADAAKSSKDISQNNDQTIIQEYVATLVKNIEVDDSEILYFYNSNKDALGGASLAQVKPQIQQFLLQQKQQEFINKYIQNMGQRVRIEISAPWLKAQAALAKDNPVDKARASGMVSLVDFGSAGCVPCDMMAPILDRLREKYRGEVNVLFIHVGEEPILASRYGIQSIPVQIFFDKTGKEVFRHTGFFPQEQIESKLFEMGVK